MCIIFIFSFIFYLKVEVLYRSSVKVIWVLSETTVTPPDLTERFLQSSFNIQIEENFLTFIFKSSSILFVIGIRAIYCVYFQIKFAILFYAYLFKLQLLSIGQPSVVRW